MSTKKVKVQKPTPKISDKISVFMANLEYVASTRDGVEYGRINKDGNEIVEKLIFNGQGVRFEGTRDELWEKLGIIKNGEIVKQGTFEKLKQQVIKLVKPHYEKKKN